MAMSDTDAKTRLDTMILPLSGGSVHPPASPRAALDQAMLETRVTDIASMIFLQWEPIRQIYERMAWMLTNDLPHPSGQPLLQVILVQSIQEFGRQIAMKPDDTESAYVEMLHQAFALLPSVLEVEVRGKKGEIWDPLADDPLGKWSQQHGPVTVTTGCPLPEAHEWTHPSQIRYAFLHRLQPPREAGQFMLWAPRIIGYGKSLH